MLGSTVAASPPGLGESSGNRVFVILAAVLVTAVWGFNFVVIAVGLKGVPPLLLAALRFLFSAVPAVFFVKRPKAPARLVMAYGLVLGVGQFGLLFSAMKIGAGAGLSSLVLQSQAFFTALLAAAFLGERFRLHHGIGMALAFGGLGVIALASQGTTAAMTGTALVMLLVAALFWATANVLARSMGKIDALGLMVWSSLVPPLPLLGLSLVLEGPSAIAASFAGLSLLSAGSIAYLAFISTLLGYGLWNHLIGRIGASVVAPFSLLVPIFGVSSAALVLGERFQPLHLVAALLVLGGLMIHVFGGRRS